jgi:ribA/ribD-fused uncharacterized protein
VERTNIRYYNKNEVISFRKTHDNWGGLSNMAPGYPILLNNIPIRNSEVLYQVFRFPNYPEIQKEILSEVSPMTAKMKSKKYLPISRVDWDKIRVSVMRWVLRVKLVSNFQNFSQLLLNTGDKTIVENSSKDDFWGACLKDEIFTGQNVLGRLLMELREEIRTLNNYELMKPGFTDAIILNKNLAKECYVNKNNIIKYEELFV